MHACNRDNWVMCMDSKTFRYPVIWCNILMLMMLLHQLFKPYIGHMQWVIILIQVSVAFCCCLFYISLCAYVYVLCTRGVTIVDQQTSERWDVEAGWHCPHTHHWLKTCSSKQHKLATRRRSVIMRMLVARSHSVSSFRHFMSLFEIYQSNSAMFTVWRSKHEKVKKNTDLIGQHKTLTQIFWVVLFCVVYQNQQCSF